MLVVDYLNYLNITSIYADRFYVYFVNRSAIYIRDA